MHPAPSIIIFTVLSGLGFGMMTWLGLGATATEGPEALTLCAIAIALVAAGLLSSLFHLGHPERFLKALTQWRSSWLSREGIASIATIATFMLFSGLWGVFSIRSAALGTLTALLALTTVFCTAMIYAQMKTVPRWHSPLTPVTFLLAAVAGGAVPFAKHLAPWLLLLLGTGLVIDALRGHLAFQRSGTTLASATGLAPGRRPRLLAPPHTGSNYLMREMVYTAGRTNAPLLFGAGLVLAVLIPALVLLSLQTGPAVAIFATVSHTAGVIVLRYLFFAQAEHVVGLYYGRHGEKI